MSMHLLSTESSSTAGVLSSFRRVLVLCAHTDDEFGCAGTLLRLREAGADVSYVALSRCEESVPAGLPRDVLETECRECTRRLGIVESRVSVADFPVRYFPSHRQEILESLVRLKRELDPQLVLLPSSLDTHQDHAVVSAEGFRAFKQSTILGYELPQNTISFSNTAFVCLTEEHMRGKIDALSAYESQGFRPYSSEGFIRGLATVRGVQCGQTYAEAFELIRLVIA